MPTWWFYAQVLKLVPQFDVSTELKLTRNQWRFSVWYFSELLFAIEFYFSLDWACSRIFAQSGSAVAPNLSVGSDSVRPSLTIMTGIEQIPLDFVSHNTPNSKYPVLVYRNVLSGSMVDPSSDEALRQEHTKKLFQTNNWRAEVSTHSVFSRSDFI